MRRRTKMIVAAISTILLIAATIIPAFALPNGPSSLNYCGLGTGTDTQYMYALEWWSTADNMGGDIPDGVATYDTQMGGFRFEDSEGWYDNTTYITVTLYTFDITNGMRLLPYYNLTSTYYINSTLYLYNRDTQEGAEAHLQQVSVYRADDTAIVEYWDGYTPIDGLAIDQERISYIKLEYRMDSSISATNIEMRNTTITQELRITDSNYESNLINFMPFAEEWFTDYNTAFDLGFSSGYSEGESIGRQIGFDQGYAQGYNDGYEAGGSNDDDLGSPIQNWSQFILNATWGFLSFEIYPGFPLWAMLSAIIVIPLLIAFLKIFAGG